jgi:hypothetical protein
MEVNKMGFGESIKNALSIVTLKGDVMQKVSASDVVGYAFLILVIAGLAGAVGQTLMGLILGTLELVSFLAFITGPIFAVIGTFIGVGILHIIALIFGGQAKYMDLFKPMAFAQVVGWVAVIPFIGTAISSILGIWLIVVNIVIIKNVHKLSTGKSVLVVLLPVIIILALVLALGAAFIAMIFGGLS